MREEKAALEKSGLEALTRPDFDWVTRQSSVWRDASSDVAELNADIARRILEKVRGLGSTPPLGWVMVGPAGAGKTHLLGRIRRQSARFGAFFILVDLTDVRDFLESVLLGHLVSLKEPEPRPQLRRLVSGLLKSLGSPPEKADQNAAALARVGPAGLKKHAGAVIRALGRQDRVRTARHADVVRAVLCFNSEHFEPGEAGYCYLQGLALDPAEQKRYGFRAGQSRPSQILQGLSWLMSLSGPTILALDQLDAVVGENRAVAGGGGADDGRREAARGLLTGLSRGLLALPENTRRTLCLISCLEATWETLQKTALASVLDRFETPMALRPVTSAGEAGGLIEGRLTPAYRAVDFRPPYPTWPFTPEALESAVGLTPRELLQKCDALRRRFVHREKVSEVRALAGDRPDLLGGGPVSEADRVAARHGELIQAVRPERWLTEDHEDDLGALVQAACRWLIREAILPGDMDLLLETRFGGGRSFKPLHARMNLIHPQRGSAETHVCYRVIEKNNPNAYQARLKAALTASGVDRKHAFRRLYVLRSGPPPDTPKCKEVTAAARRAGAVFLPWDPDDLRTIVAVAKLEREAPEGFNEWMATARPASGLSFLRESLPEIESTDAEPEKSNHDSAG